MNAQIAGLNRTIEDLNACFLTLTDELVASGLLEHHPQVTKVAQRTIESFIALIRESQGSQKDDQDASDFHSSVSTTPEPPSLEIDLLRDSGTLKHKEVAVKSVPNAAPWEAAGQPWEVQSFPYQLVPSHNPTVNFMPQLPILESMDPLRPTFAHRLHLEAMRAGLRLAITAEDRSLEVYRVFHLVLDSPTRHALVAALSMALNDSFNQLHHPPPESDVDRSCFNASDVARYFRTIGMDFDGMHGIVTVKMHPGSSPARVFNEGPPAITFRGDGLKESPHPQPPHDSTYVSGTAHSPFTSTAQDVGVYATRGHDMSHVSIDVSRLIHGEYLSFPSDGEHWLTST